MMTKVYKAVVIADEGEMYVKTVKFKTKEELRAYRKGMEDNSDGEGKGWFSVYTRKDLKADYLDDEIKKIIEKRLPQKTKPEAKIDD